MRIALLADTHGNLVALEAVLADLATRPPDQFVCLGDVSLGPQPYAVLERVRTLGCPVVMGNCDEPLLGSHTAPPTGSSPGPFDDLERWCAAKVTPEHAAFIRTFQPTVRVELGAGRTLLCYHGSPRSYDEAIEPLTPLSELDEFFAGQQADILAGGHTHIQMLRRYQSSLLINPGSVGLPFDRYPTDAATRNPAWAEYAVVEADGPRLNLELHRVPYDLDALKRAIRASGMPHSEEWLADWVAQ